MSGPVVSVIIPVYNRGKMLEQSIKSVQDQTLKNVEIICVDDGSTDDTLSMLEEISKNDKRIVIVSQNNAGPGVARNNGIRHAKGEFIAFLDSDDRYMDNDALEKMTKACDEHGVNICGARFGWSQDGRFRENTYFESFDKDIPEGGRLVGFNEYQFDPGFWSFIYRRQMLVNNSFFFPPYKQYEDPVFFLNVMNKEKDFWFLPIHLLEVRVWPHDENRQNENLHSILDGIFTNLRMAYESGYRILYKRLIERIDVDYRYSLIESMSYELLSKLLEIDNFNRSCEYYQPINLLNEIYDVTHKLFFYKMPDRNLIPNELRSKLDHIEKDRFVAYFVNKKISKIGIYGIGAFGNALYILAKEIGLEIAFIMDKNIKEYDGIRVLKPHENIPDCDAIVVSPLHADAIVSELNKVTNLSIISFNALVNELDG